MKSSKLAPSRSNPMDHMSFEELLAAQEQVDSPPATSRPADERPKRRDPTARPMSRKNAQAPLPVKAKRSSEKPTAMSSKRPVSRFRQVIATQGKRTRDPRFDEQCGHLNEGLFKQAYKFLDGYQQHEEAELRAELKATKDLNRREQIKRTLSVMASQRNTEEQKAKRKQIIREHRKTEMEHIEKGKQPYYLKKADIKQVELAEKFKDIKDPQRLEKVMERRRKRNAAKDHRSLPYQRRSA
ncbi:rRNA biogenesis protein rrp36 [Dimargaris verticillata]|uniref:rRNA biogenesis protein RRP36 n=1 Tax=Dimargaris verticillata TaxID=2761393 RepID=A0A9W8B6X8_9FUNG|nr:rRNA biogenesis protein rrp36 [Dimargaris verticillata]